MVIFITKTTQILEILYPDAIPTSNFEFVATVVLPDIQKLVGMTSIHTQAHISTEESKRLIQCTSAPNTDNIDSAELKTCSNPIFIEEPKHKYDSTWKKDQYKQSKYIKKGD